MSKWNCFKKKVLEDDEFSNKYGYLGDVYGKQWRAWKRQLVRHLIN